MPEITTIGIDIAKNVFQLHGVDRSGNIVLRKALRRGQVPGSSHTSALPDRHGGLRNGASLGPHAMGFGHDVRLIPPAYVKPYLSRQKNDAADAAAICEAVTGRRCASCRSRARAAKHSDAA